MTSTWDIATASSPTLRMTRVFKDASNPDHDDRDPPTTGEIAQRPKRLRTKKSMPVPVRRFPLSLSRLRLEMASTADSRHLRLRDGPPKSRCRCGDLPPR